MNLVATEADAVKPLIIDTILTVAGERYDFVIEANQLKRSIINEILSSFMLHTDFVEISNKNVLQ